MLVCLLARRGVRRRRRRDRDRAAPASRWPCSARCSRSSPPTRTRCWTSRPSRRASRRSSRSPGAARRSSSARPPSSGTAYYLWTFTWGLGWAPSLAAVGGAILLLVRRRLTMALVLLPAPIAFIIYMGDQQRFFGRWLMPIFPIVSLLGGLRNGRVRALAGRARRQVPVLLAGTLATVVMLGQGVGDRGPQRPRAVAPRHAQPGPQVDGRPRPGGSQGRDRAGRRGQLGDRCRPFAAVRPQRRALAAVSRPG